MTRPIALTAAALLSGCAAELHGLRAQESFAVAPAGTQVALVSVTLADGVSTAGDPTALLKAGLALAFQTTSFALVDETSAAATIEIAPELPFTVTLPAALPGTAPLVLGVRIVDLEMTPDGADRPRITADLMYTLWTRAGREVETRAVQVTGCPNLPFRAGLRITPLRARALRWDDDATERARYASRDEQKLLTETLAASAAAFFFPYGRRAVWFSATMDKSDSALKPGLELSLRGDLDAAYLAFESVTSFPGAVFNMGVIREVQGRDDEALALYDRTLATGGSGRSPPKAPKDVGSRSAKPFAWPEQRRCTGEG